MREGREKAERALLARSTGCVLTYIPLNSILEALTGPQLTDRSGKLNRNAAQATWLVEATLYYSLASC